MKQTLLYALIFTGLVSVFSLVRYDAKCREVARANCVAEHAARRANEMAGLALQAYEAGKDEGFTMCEQKLRGRYCQL